MRIKVALAVGAVILAAAVTAGEARADVIYEAINASFSSGFFVWLSDDTGWYWTPATDVALTGIFTKLTTATNANNNITFTTTVYTDRPAAGGTVLDSFTWNGTSFVDGPWLGGTFSSPLHLTGGTTYLLGFSGWSAAVGTLGANSGAGVMMVGPEDTTTGNAFPGTTLLPGYISGVPGSFDTAYAPNSWPHTPVLRFTAESTRRNTSTIVPEQASLSLLGFGVAAVAIRARYRRRQS